MKKPMTMIGPRALAQSVAGALAALLSVSPAIAQERDYCPTRPGLGTTPCTIDQGRMSVEIGLASWTRDTQSNQRSDQINLGDTLVRAGINDHVELFAGWQPYGQVRTETWLSGQTGARSIEKAKGSGDVTLGLKASLAHPDGSGFSVAVQPFVTLPTGGNAVGAGDWGAGLVLPMSYALPNDWSLQLTPEMDAAVDGDRKGRHFAASAVVGLSHPVSDTLSATAEVQVARDEDPAGAKTQALGGLSLAWMQGDAGHGAAVQWDIGTQVGLNRAAPDIAFYAGVSRRF